MKFYILVFCTYIGRSETYDTRNHQDYQIFSNYMIGYEQSPVTGIVCGGVFQLMQLHLHIIGSHLGSNEVFHWP